MELSRLRLGFSATLSWLRGERMKASKFSDTQKAFIIKRGDEGTPVAAVCRKADLTLDREMVRLSVRENRRTDVIWRKI
jgi:hypothetical protein